MSHSKKIFYRILVFFLFSTGHFYLRAQSFKLDTIVYKGDPAHYINLVFLGDGFQTAQLPSYLENVRKLNNYVFSISPFAEYSNFFNVFAISVPSSESGANHPGTATDESSSGNQPVLSVNTAFNSTFDYAAIHRLLVPQNFAAIYDVLNKSLPFYDQVFMLVNSTYYGGSGSPNLATSSLNISSFDVLVHEIGHSFGNLADEYYAGDNYAGEAVNMTQESNPALVKWKDWIGVDGVGVYQHCCGGNSAQWYKPHQSCKMQMLSSPFCAVCKERIIEKIYDLVPSLSSFEPPAQNTIDYCAAPVTFKLNVNKPIPNTLKITWRLNGTVVASNIDSLFISAGQLNSNSNTLSAIVIDTTPMVRAQSHYINHSDTVTWNISNPVKIPNVTAAGPTTFCEGKSVTLRSDALSGNQWYKDGVPVTDSIAATFVARESGSYIVKTKVNDCESGASNAVNVIRISNPSPVVSASSTSLCMGQSVVLTTTAGAGNIYQWKKDNINVPAATGPNYSASVPGVYSVFVITPEGCSATSSGVTVTTGLPPLATIAAAGPTTFCAGKSVLLKATVGSGYTYQWRKSGVVLVGATSSDYVAGTNGVFTVQVTNAGGCSATSAAINVTVNPVPTATVAAGGPLTFCAGKSVLLKATLGAGYSYQWKKGGVKLQGQTSSNFTATETGIYSVEVNNASGCSLVSSSFNVAVNSLPLATITPNGPSTFCSGKNVILRANTGTGYTHQWKRGGANIAGATAFTYTATTTGTYTVIVTNASGCFVVSPATTVVINPLPIATITPVGSLTFCVGKNVLLRANTGTAYTYQWKKAGINVADNGAQANYAASVSGIYSVAVTNTYGCSVSSAGVTVSVNNAPLATIAAAGPTTFCAGKNVLLKAIAGTGYTYKWRRLGVILAGQTLSTYLADATGVYSVEVTNVAGCSTVSAGIAVTSTPAPTATLVAAGPTTFCAGKTVLLKAIVGTGYTYQWKKDGNNIPAQTSSTLTANATGLYTVVVTNAQGCPTASAGINVTVNPAPLGTITATGPLTFPQGGNVVLNASMGTGYTYQWKRDGVPINGATTSNYSATLGGSYTVVITNSNLCQASTQPVQVTVTSERAITKSTTYLNVYPNPVYRDGYLTIEGSLSDADKGILVTISDVTGRMIHSRFLKPGEKKLRIPGASGVYMVEIRWGPIERRVFRIIKIE